MWHIVIGLINFSSLLQIARRGAWVQLELCILHFIALHFIKFHALLLPKIINYIFFLKHIFTKVITFELCSCVVGV